MKTQNNNWDKRRKVKQRVPEWYWIGLLLLVAIAAASIDRSYASTTPPIALIRDVTYADISDSWVPAHWGEVLAAYNDTPNFVELHGGTVSVMGVTVETWNATRGGGTLRSFTNDQITGIGELEPTVRTNYWVVARRWVDNLTPDSPFGRARGSCRR